MALPGTFTVAEAMTDAFERIGKSLNVIGMEAIYSVQRSIRLLLADWNTDGVLFWKVSSGNLHAMALNETSFTPITGTIDILDMAVRRDSVDKPLGALARADWFALANKLVTEGQVISYWVERNVTTPLIHLYPKNNNATDVIVYDAILYFNDSTNIAAAADIPERWIEAFVSGLTAKLAEKFAPDRLAEKLALYGGPGVMQTTFNGQRLLPAYRRARMGDRERGDTVMKIRRRP